PHALLCDAESIKFYSAKKDFVERRIVSGEGNPGLLGLDVAMDISLIGDSDFFVGTFSSSLGRIGVMLMANKKNYVPPYISLDYAWCQAAEVDATAGCDEERLPDAPLFHVKGLRAFGSLRFPLSPVLLFARVCPLD
ncbi:hypothetical protein CYMTET_14110, partial [Cymbomonas tetramitiformis]